MKKETKEFTIYWLLALIFTIIIMYLDIHHLERIISLTDVVTLYCALFLYVKYC